MSGPNLPEEPILELIGRIRERQIDPRGLEADDRRRCVETLRYEGYSVAEIAKVLRRHERTIQRDLEELRARNALTTSPALVARTVGEFVQQSEASIARLRRIARESSLSGMERLMAESAAWRICDGMMSRLQSLGYLPRVPHGLVAEISTAADPLRSYEQLEQRIRELGEVDLAGGGDDAERATRRAALLDQVQRGRLSVQVERLCQTPETPAHD